MRRSLRLPPGEARRPSGPPSVRRANGWLADAIIAFLEEREPTTAHAIGLALRRDFPRLLGSAVFISIKRLHDRGLVHRVECSKSYTVAPTRDPVHLLCGVCGGYVQRTDEELGRLLRAQADREGFAPHRLVLEVVGICPRCERRPADLAVERNGA